MTSIHQPLAFIVTLISILTKAETCEGEIKFCNCALADYYYACFGTVEVALPWERNTYVPQGSSVRVNCTANSSEQSPVWSILLSGKTAISQFSFPETIRLLNNRGFYQVMVPEVQPGAPKTIALFINSTEENNGTVIKCSDVGSAALFSETNLIVYGKNN